MVKGPEDLDISGPKSYIIIQVVATESSFRPPSTAFVDPPIATLADMPSNKPPINPFANNMHPAGDAFYQAVVRNTARPTVPQKSKKPNRKVVSVES